MQPDSNKVYINRGKTLLSLLNVVVGLYDPNQANSNDS